MLTFKHATQEETDSLLRTFYDGKLDGETRRLYDSMGLADTPGDELKRYANFGSRFTKEGSVVLLTKKDDLPVGFSVYSPSPGLGCWELDLLVVHSKFASRGIEMRLVDETVRDVIRRGGGYLRAELDVSNSEFWKDYHEYGSFVEERVGVIGLHTSTTILLSEEKRPRSADLEHDLSIS